MATKKTAWKKPLPDRELYEELITSKKQELAHLKKVKLPELLDDEREFSDSIVAIQRDIIEGYGHLSDLRDVTQMHSECLREIREVRSRITKLTKEVNMKRPVKRIPMASAGFSAKMLKWYPPSQYALPKKASGKKRTAKRVSSNRK